MYTECCYVCCYTVKIMMSLAITAPDTVNINTCNSSTYKYWLVSYTLEDYCYYRTLGSDKVKR